MDYRPSKVGTPDIGAYKLNNDGSSFGNQEQGVYGELLGTTGRQGCWLHERLS